MTRTGNTTLEECNRMMQQCNELMDDCRGVILHCEEMIKLCDNVIARCDIGIRQCNKTLGKIDDSISASLKCKKDEYRNRLYCSRKPKRWMDI